MDIKKLSELIGDRRVTNKLINELIDVNLERTSHKSCKEVEYYSFDKVYNISDLENIVNIVKKKYGSSAKIEINEYEVVVFQEVKIEESDKEVLTRLASLVRKLRTLEKQLKKFEE
jgi:hypothetical protein